ncbi:hypothetical protein H0H81_003396, partial [Sphagnurus paluster]
MAWGAPAEFFPLDVQGLPTPNSHIYEAVGFRPVNSLNTVKLPREQENWDEALVRGYL